MAVRKWFDAFFQTKVGAGGGAVPDEVAEDFPLNFLFVTNNITRLTRVLVGWHFETNLMENSLIGDAQPLTPALSVAYQPSPDGEGSSTAETFAGDKLWREHLSPVPYYWTDGAVHSTKWWADSGQPRSGQAQRIIHDRTTAKITVSMSLNTTGEIVSFADTAPVDWSGFIWVAFLLEKAV